MDQVDIIYEPVGTVKVDILFIHGLGADWRETWNLSSFQSWYFEEGKSDTLLPSLSASWTSEDSKSVSRFPHYSNLQHTRLLAWGSNEIDPLTFTYEQLAQLARSLSSAIRKCRGQNNRHIIFVAHSIGGLILKEALVHIQAEQTSFFRSVAGIVLFAVPFFQCKTDWAKFLYLLRRKNHRPSKKWRFMALHKLDSAFAELVLTHEIKLCCVYEEKPVYRRGILVPKDHALPELRKAYTRLTLIPAPTDHFDITRLDPRVDTNYYLRVVEQIDSMASIAADHEKYQAQSNLVKTKVQPKKGNSRTGFTCEHTNEILELLQDRKEERELVLYASASYEEGRYHDAKSAYNEALGVFKTSTDKERLLSLYCKDRLANVLFELGESESAAKLCTDILEIKKENYSSDYISILRTTRTHAMVLTTQQEFHLAGKSIAQLLESHKGLQPGSYEYIETLNVLAKVLKDQNCCEFAEFLLREVIEAATRLLGEKNPYTLARLSELSSLLWLRGHYSQAEEISWYAYGALETCLGIYHPAVFSAAERCAGYLRARGRLEQSSDILCAILPRMKAMLGKTHPATLRTKSGIAANYILEGRIAEGADLLREINRKQPANHRDRIWTSQTVGHLWEWQGKDSKVYPEWLDCNKIPQDFENFLMQPIEPINRRITDYFYGERTPKLSLPEPSLLSTADQIRHRVFCGEPVEEEDLQNPKSAGDYYGTLLHAAAFMGNLSLIKMLINKGADVDYECGVFITPMKAAIIGGHSEVVRYLLEQSKGQEASLFLTNLEVAIHFERVTIVKILLTQENANHWSPQFGSSLNQAIPTAQVAIVKLLLDKAGVDHARAGLANRSSFIQEAVTAAGDVSGEKARSGYGSISLVERKKNTVEVLNMLMEWASKDAVIIKIKAVDSPSLLPFLDGKQPFEVVRRSSIPPVKSFFPHLEIPFSLGGETRKTRSRRRTFRIPTIRAR